MNRLEAWMRSRGWGAFEFQRAAWAACRAGRSGLIHAPTGAGKTLAVWGGALLEHLQRDAPDREARADASSRDRAAAEPARVIWLTPLRALANDTAESLREPVEALNLPWSVELRTGDTPQSIRQRQRSRLPTALVTTPESLSILLSYPDTSRQLAGLRLVVVDEWHELLGNKRGVQAELCLARLRRLAPGLRTWGLSATLGNIQEAAAALVGTSPDHEPLIIRGAMTKRIEVETLLPDSIERFPWSGHLGVKLLPQLIDRIEQAQTTLLFTNTRSQAEIWYRELLMARPDWMETLAIHHGSLDREVREGVEERLRRGELRCVVCTSSLDLGVDFLPVEQVMQLGSPKGIARLMQRAGRSGHQPGAVSRVIGVPTNAFELVEFAAARDAIERALDSSGEATALEHRRPLDRPLDVLAQHLVTLGIGEGFNIASMREEVRSTHAYRRLSHEEWQWTIDFVSRGGPSLTAYPEFSRVAIGPGDFARVESKQIIRRHRMTIGTITSDSAIRIVLQNGTSLGTIEERFIGRLRRDERFFFAGRLLQLVRMRGMTAVVRPATRAGRGSIPRWMGGRSPLSTQLAGAVRQRLDEARRGEYRGAEMQRIRPILELQQRWSRIPAPDELQIERSSWRGAHHVFIFSFAGRLVHEGLTALVGYRITRRLECSMSMSSNDYGFELQTREPLPFDESQWREILSPEALLDDLLKCLNETELARQRFRGIAQIAGLVFPGYPGEMKKMRHLQASSDLFFDVFRDFDPENLLLDQARREVLERELELDRMRSALERMTRETMAIIDTRRFSPLAFPLWAESIRTQQMSSESWLTRVQRMAAELERAALGAVKQR